MNKISLFLERFIGKSTLAIYDKLLKDCSDEDILCLVFQTKNGSISSIICWRAF